MFNENSGLVKVWVSLVLAGTYTVDQVPQLSNLKEIVAQVVNSVKWWIVYGKITLDEYKLITGNDYVPAS